MSYHRYPILPKTLTIVHDRSIDECVGTFRNAICDRTDALGIMLNNLDDIHKNERDLRHLFSYASDRPILAMNYRHRRDGVRPESDDQLADTLLMSVRAGANICDLMGDLFDEAPNELTRNEAAIDRQKRVIDKAHELGAKVLMSSHTWRFMGVDEVIGHFKELEARGGDLVKIAMIANDELQLEQVFIATVALRRELRVPYIFVCMGQYGKTHRILAPMLGAEYALCVQDYSADTHREQVLLRNARVVYDSVDWGLARDTNLGTIRPDLREFA